MCYHSFPRFHFRHTAVCGLLPREHLLCRASYLWFPKSAMLAAHKTRLGGCMVVHHYHLHISVIGCAADDDTAHPTKRRTPLPEFSAKTNVRVLDILMHRSGCYLLDTWRADFDLRPLRPSCRLDWLIERHFGESFPANLLWLSTEKLNPTQQKQTCIRNKIYYSTK